MGRMLVAKRLCLHIEYSELWGVLSTTAGVHELDYCRWLQLVNR